jgi:hypothetical protein
MSSTPEQLQDELEILKGASDLALRQPTAAARVHSFLYMLRQAGPISIFQELLDIESGTAILKTPDKPKDRGDCLNNVGIIGSACVPGVQYLEWHSGEEDEGVKGFTLNIVPLTFVDYDPQIELGYKPYVAQLPIDQIRTCYPVA